MLKLYLHLHGTLNFLQKYTLDATAWKIPTFYTLKLSGLAHKLLLEDALSIIHDEITVKQHTDNFYILGKLGAKNVSSVAN